MNDRNRCFAVLAVAVFVMSACLFMVPSEESDAGLTTSQVQVVDYVDPQAEGTMNEGGRYDAEYRVASNDDGGWHIDFRNTGSDSGWLCVILNDSDDPADGGQNMRMSFGAFSGSEWKLYGTTFHFASYIHFFYTSNADIYDNFTTSKVTESEIVTLQVYTKTVTKYNYTTSATFDYNYEGAPESVSNSVSESSLGSTLDKEIQFTVPEDPVREGLIFIGWATSPNGEVVIEPGSETVDVQIGEDMTYYAIWEVPGYVITYMVDGEVWKTEKVPYDTATVSPTPDPDPPEMYIFAGWYTSTEYTERFQFGHTLDGDITLYAKWQDEFGFTTIPTAEYNVIKVDNADRTFLFTLGANAMASKVLWDFGDGVTSESINPTHFYKEPGVYEVTLTVYNSHGTDTKTFSIDATGDGGSDSGWLLYVALVLVLVIIAIVVIRQFL